MGFVDKMKPSKDSGGKINVGANYGQKYILDGPTCKYNGKQIDCLTFTSENNGIPIKILIQILEFFDAKEVFPWVFGGPIPMLLIECH